jgi:predicted RNase H-like HicB family nuclease
MSKETYLVHFELTKKGTFSVTIPSLPGCQATAPTFEQAFAKVKKSIERHLKALAKAGKTIPKESHANPPICINIEVTAPKHR